ncbi:MAG: DUF1302 family protein [Desulfobacterales bacterium]
MRTNRLFFCLFVACLAGWVSAAHGASFLDDRLSVDGYIQNQSSYRTGNDSGLVSSENRLQLEMSARLHPNVTVTGTFRGIYDAIYDLRHDSDQWAHDDGYAGSRDALSTEYKIRELYMDATLGSVDFRIGKQQVVWGETDGLRLMDIINPLDERRQFITREWEDIRIPLTVVKATYGINTQNNSFLELLWNPGDIQRDKIYFDTTMSDRHKSPWTTSNPDLLEKLKVDAPLAVGGPGGPSLTDPQNYLDVPMLRTMGILNFDEGGTPSQFSVRNSEFGARLGGELGGFFLTLNYFQGFSKTPVIKYKGGGLLGMGNALAPGTSGPPLYVGAPVNNTFPDVNTAIAAYLSGMGYDGLLKSYPIKLSLEYPRENVIGFTFNKAAGLWVWRGEFATYLNKHYNKVGRRGWNNTIWDIDSAIRETGDMVDDKVLQASMLGFDYKNFITWLNPEKMFFISGQVFNYHIFNHQDELCTGPYMQKTREDSYYLTLLVNTEYSMGRICPEVLVVYDVSSTGWYVKPRVEFKYGDHWRPEIGALIFTGDRHELPFGELANNDEVYVRLRYQF